MQSAHDLDVQGLQCMACWLNEVDACMDTVVNDVHAVDLVLRIQVCIKSLLDVVNNWSPRLVVVDKVTKAWGIDNSQAKTNTVLLNIRAD